MILVVTPNPAIDVTYRVDRQAFGTTVRVREVWRRAGGKGLNVARVLHSLDRAVTAVQPLGGANGAWVAGELAADGIPACSVDLPSETRSTVTVLDGLAHPTVLAEPGPALTRADAERLVAAVAQTCATSAAAGDPVSAVVISGSLAPGTDGALVASLVEAAHQAGAKAVVDTGGPALLAAARAGADVLMPNADEAMTATATSDLDAAARALTHRGAGLVVISQGPAGLVALDRAGTRWAQRAVPGVAGNPTGAGDAATAGLVAALAGGAGVADALREAAVLGAAAVLEEIAGSVDLTALAGLSARLDAAPSDWTVAAPRAAERPVETASDLDLDLVRTARASGRGLGAFNVVLLEHAEAIVAGAERAGLPVILQISQNAIAYHGGLEALTLATLSLARRAAVPAVVHLDHADDVDLVRASIALGVRSVMFDGSHLPYPENVALTRQVVAFCHAHGVLVEAELGEVGGKDGVHAPGARTRPEEAAAFVAATGVDSLAVAVGTSHAMTERVAAVDVALISDLADALPVPLVLHGSSGLSDDQLRAAVAAGMTKINISTHLNGLFTGTVREVLGSAPGLVDPRKYVAPAREVVATEIDRLLRLLAQSGRT